MAKLTRPKHRFNPQFVHLVDEHDKIVTEHLAKRFVDHRHVGLAAKRIAKLPFHHGERATPGLTSSVAACPDRS